MNKSISNILLVITLLLSFTACQAQIKNVKIETVKIYGNCEMCKKVIEKAGNLKKVAKVDWNADTKMATITYDTKKTNQDAILKRIALSGYDSDKFLAPENVYNNLPGCCQYDRTAKFPVKVNAVSGVNMPIHSEMNNHENQPETPKAQVQESSVSQQANETNQLKAVFDNYFAVKDALVKTDGNTASAKAKELLLAINTIKMEKLSMEEQTVWMKVLSNLKEDVEHISDTKNASHQRDHFITLSISVYKLIKVSKQDSPTYFQHCPMANDGKGADWLSKENTIKNPYYGSMMLSCGKTLETIK